MRAVRPSPAVRPATVPAATALAAAVLATTVLAACTGEEPSATPAPGPTPQVTVELLQHRRDVDLRRLHLAVTNTGPGPVTVQRPRLDAPDFASRPAGAATATLAPGQRVDLPVSYGPARCPASAGATGTPARAAPAAAALAVRAGDGSPAELRVPLAHPHRLLDGLLHAECRRAALLDLVDAQLAGPWTTDRGVLTGTLQLRRRPGAAEDTTVAVTQLAGSVLFTVRPRGALPVLAAGSDGAAVPVAVTPGRCDPHARLESKQSFRFLLWLRVDGGPEEPLLLDPDPEVRRRLEGYLAGACASA